MDLLAETVREVDQLAGVHAARAAHARELEQTVTQLTGEVQLLGLVEAALNSLLAQTSAESLKVIEDVITYGLRTVFDDLQLQFKFRVSTLRGQQALEPVLLDGPVEAPILEAFGGGPASLVAFLLRVLVARKLGLYPLLVLDESFSMVSVQYVPNMARLLRELAGQLGMTFVLVTHQTEFLVHADRAYTAVESANGTVFRTS